MVQRITNIIYLFMIAIFASCSPESEIQEPSVVHISFQTAVTSSAVSQTRSIIEGDQLPEGLPVGIYATPADHEIWNNPSLSNIKLFSDVDGGLTPGIEASLLDASDIDFYAYSRHTESLEFIDGVPCLPITIKTDFIDQEDFLYAHTRASLSGKETVVSLNFKHVLSRLKFYAETPKKSFDQNYGPVFDKIIITTDKTQTDCVLNLKTGLIEEKEGAVQNKQLEKTITSKVPLYNGNSPLLLAQNALIPSQILSITVVYRTEYDRVITKVFNESDLAASGLNKLDAGFVQPIYLKYDNNNITLRKPDIQGEVTIWEDDNNDYRIEIQ